MGVRCAADAAHGVVLTPGGLCVIIKKMSSSTRVTRVLVAAAMLWAGFHACWMPQANCEQPKPPCHQDKDSSPASHSCCGGLHLSAAATPHPAAALDAGLLESVCAAAPSAAAELPGLAPVSVASDAGPPGYGPPALLSSPSRSPPAA